MSTELEPPHSRLNFSGFIGDSPRMQEVYSTLHKITHFKTTVLLVGESGTGKELFARSIHNNSERSHKPFIAINCGAIPEHLMESELFGHRKGSFTDATRDRKGLFEEASGGTLFLDEIGELPIHLQSKLLRVLQDSKVRPVGSEELIHVDVRLIAATLRDLEQDTIDGRFRDDLYYRLNVLQLSIPPLRERIGDLAPLTDFLLEKISKRLAYPKPQVTSEAFLLLEGHLWPGNIRELENYLERAMILSDGTKILTEHLPEKLKRSEQKTSALYLSESDSLSIKEHTRYIEKYLIEKALKKTSGNRTHAAKILEISHRALLYKLKEYKLDAEKAEKDKTNGEEHTK